MRLLTFSPDEIDLVLTPAQKECGLLGRGSCEETDDLETTCFTAQHCARCSNQGFVSQTTTTRLDDNIRSSGCNRVFLCLMSSSSPEEDVEVQGVGAASERDGVAGEEVVAGCVLVQAVGAPGDHQEVWLWSVCTDSRYRKQGVATSLLKEVSTTYKDTPLFLKVDAIHKRESRPSSPYPRAIEVVRHRYSKLAPFYASFGFEPLPSETETDMETWVGNPEKRSHHFLAHKVFGYTGLHEQEARFYKPIGRR